MYIKSYQQLSEHPHGARLIKKLNRHIYKTKFKACVFLPSYLLSTAEFCNTFQKTQLLDVSHALSKFSPYETQLLCQAIDAGTDVAKLKVVHDRIRNANRLTARFIASEIERLERESPVISAIKNIFTSKEPKNVKNV